MLISRRRAGMIKLQKTDVLISIRTSVFCNFKRRCYLNIALNFDIIAQLKNWW